MTEPVRARTLYRPLLPTKEYDGLAAISGPIIVVEGASGVGYDEAAEVLLPNGEIRRGRVLEASTRAAVVEVWGGTSGLQVSGTRVRFAGQPLRAPVATAMLGRVLNSLGEPMDGIAPPVAEDRRDVNGAPINPTRRTYPRDLIVTGISAIDGMNTLIRGQKLPVFSGAWPPRSPARPRSAAVPATSPLSLPRWASPSRKPIILSMTSAAPVPSTARSCS